MNPFLRFAFTAFILAAATAVPAQLYMTVPEMEEAYGSDYITEDYDDGTRAYIYIKNEVSDRSGAFERIIAYVFGEVYGRERCIFWRIADPLTETGMHIDLLNANFERLNTRMWLDSSDSTVYTLRGADSLTVLTVYRLPTGQ